MKKKALALAVAGAFFAPASYAAQDNAGMHYTSAAEGFYASIRTKFATESSKDGGAGIANSGSRFGIRGSNDLGNGMKGFYQYEAGVSTDNGGGLSTRLGHVGLEGAFGRVWAGSGWTESYNMVYGSTDIANNGSGSIAYGHVNGMRPGRANNMIQYRTPDISGFQGALGVNMKAGADNDTSSESKKDKRVGIDDKDTPNDPSDDEVAILPAADADKDDNNVEMWTAVAKYSVQGFTGAFAYSVKPDMNFDGSVASDRSYATGNPVNGVRPKTGDASTNAAHQGKDSYTTVKKDMTAWTARLGYAQDNWSVDGWYGKNNRGDFGSAYFEDATFFSMAGNVSVGKVNLYAVWEKSEAPTKAISFQSVGHDSNIRHFEANARDNEEMTTVVGVSYQLGSQSKVWMDYVAQDLDSSTTEEDYVNIGLRHDF